MILRLPIRRTIDKNTPVVTKLIFVAQGHFFRNMTIPKIRKAAEAMAYALATHATDDFNEALVAKLEELSHMSRAQAEKLLKEHSAEFRADAEEEEQT